MKILTLASSAILLCAASALNASVVLIDIGSSSFPTAGNWNNVTHASGKSSLNSTIADLIDDAGASTGFSLASVAATVGANETGPTSTTTSFPSTATMDSFYIEGTESVSFTFSNLDAGQTYDFTFFAGRNGSGTARIANYEIIGGNKTESTQLNGYGNSTNTVSLSGFTADGSNQITINFTRVSGAYAYLGVVEMTTTAIPEPGHYALGFAVLGGLVALRRRKRA